MRLGTAGVLVVLAAVACSGDEDAARETTTTAASSSVTYTDCDAIQAGDQVAADAAGIVCKPGQAATLDAVDCTDGTYIRLIRPKVGDLEGITARTEWRTAGTIDATLGRTRFAFENCHES